MSPSQTQKIIFHLPILIVLKLSTKMRLLPSSERLKENLCLILLVKIFLDLDCMKPTHLLFPTVKALKNNPKDSLVFLKDFQIKEKKYLVLENMR